jgi:hypothetical protein
MAAVLVTGLTPAVDEHALREFFSYRRARACTCRAQALRTLFAARACADTALRCAAVR